MLRDLSGQRVEMKTPNCRATGYCARLIYSELKSYDAADARSRSESTGSRACALFDRSRSYGQFNCEPRGFQKSHANEIYADFAFFLVILCYLRK